MTSCKRILYTDIETYSATDIKASGSFKYMEDPDFQILLVSYAWDDEPVRVLDLLCPELGDEIELSAIQAGLMDPDVLKISHNCAFERNAYHQAWGIYCPPEQWLDTMILAAYNGLPMSLDAAGEALELPDQKIKEGVSLIRYFCCPCKPTVANGGRTRNLPEHAPDKWQRFKAYADRDVVTMREIYHRLKGYKVTDFERQVWATDARINERGVMVDRELVKAAMDVDTAFKEKSLNEMAELSGLANPNSVSQLKGWLSGAGLDVDSLDKNVISDLKASTNDKTTKRVLELRQQLSKTSTKKYETMDASAGNDDRIRGIMQYYGAARTGRWAGRLVQLQNLPQNHLDHIEEVREIVRARDLDTLDMLFDSVPDTLSQLIRTALIAKPGHTFLVADYSAIEARVIAYLAGEQWRMDTFRNGGDIYCQSASQMFKVPVVKHGINGHLRQKGKIAELACIAEGQLVLTDEGVVPIEQVTKDMKVWDGVNWVNHDGVIYKGEKEVITYGGLEATADHIVWTEDKGKYWVCQFGEAAARGAHLLHTGDGGYPLRMGGNYQPGKTVEHELESLPRADEMCVLREDELDGHWKSEDRKIERLPELFTEESGSDVAGEKIHRCEAKVHEPEGQQLQELRCSGHRVSVPVCNGRGGLHDREIRNAGQENGNRPNRCERTLRARESQMGDPQAELPEPKKVSRKVRVYDILNAGPAHRFTVSGVLVHNCGYGGGVGALKAFGADKMGLTEEEMQTIVTQWREASPTIPALWRNVEKAAITALNNPGKTVKVPGKVYDPERARENEAAMGAEAGSYSDFFNNSYVVCAYKRDGDALRCWLPSGRILTYWGARLDEEGTIVFKAQNQTTRKWEDTSTWGGKLVENIVQAFARDCLATAMVRLEAEGRHIVFHVHDEVIVEAPAGSKWEDVAEVMGRPLDWAPGLILRGDGYETFYYRKD